MLPEKGAAMAERVKNFSPVEGCGGGVNSKAGAERLAPGGNRVVLSLLTSHPMLLGPVTVAASVAAGGSKFKAFWQSGRNYTTPRCIEHLEKTGPRIPFLPKLPHNRADYNLRVKAGRFA